MLFAKLIAAIAVAGVVTARPRRDQLDRGSHEVDDGTCGSNGLSCLGSSDGPCCSRYGYCGDSAPYCSTGCQSKYGACWGYPDPPPPTKEDPPVSKNSRCGAKGKEATCKGSQFGECCSKYGMCNVTLQFRNLRDQDGAEMEMTTVHRKTVKTDLEIVTLVQSVLQSEHQVRKRVPNPGRHSQAPLHQR
jgi:hypothetical protein